MCPLVVFYIEVYVRIGTLFHQFLSEEFSKVFSQFFVTLCIWHWIWFAAPCDFPDQFEQFLCIIGIGLIILYRQSFFLNFSIVLYLFHSLTNAFQRWSSWCLIHFHSLFFIIVLCCLRSSPYHGLGFLFAVLTIFCGAISSRPLSTSFAN